MKFKNWLKQYDNSETMIKDLYWNIQNDPTKPDFKKRKEWINHLKAVDVSKELLYTFYAAWAILAGTGDLIIVPTYQTKFKSGFFHE